MSDLLREEGGGDDGVVAALGGDALIVLWV